MKDFEEVINNSKFEYLGNTYDCKYIIERDKENILREADCSHKDEIDKLYDRETLTPIKCKVYTDSADNIAFVMVVYKIDYRDGCGARLACGDYYPVNEGYTIHPHPYQASICW